MLYQISWINWISVPFRENSNVIYCVLHMRVKQFINFLIKQFKLTYSDVSFDKFAKPNFFVLLLSQ